MRLLGFLVAFILAWAPNVARADGQGLRLDGDRYWVVIASRQDADQAIAAALPQREARVVHAENGWFAAITGPVTAPKGTGRKVLDAVIADKSLPKDAYLTQGAAFTDIVWTRPATHEIAALAYDGVTAATLRRDGLVLTLARKKSGDDGFLPTATATYQGKPAFSTTITSDYPTEKPAADATLVILDPSSPLPQIVLTYFWQGAHCCTLTKIATLAKDGTWHLVDGETIDGGGGYDFEDIEGKGYSLLVSSDQDFYYAFASYAESITPIRLHQLVGEKLVDVTNEPRFQHRLLQNLYGDEANAAANADMWHSNGFLAAWVAESAQVGRGPAAWTKMLTTYDHHSDFTPQKCLIAKPIGDCPPDKTVRLAFPFALRAFLTEHGYIKDASLYPAPDEVEPKEESAR